jgi:coenzyme F420 hydrogenase subunit beta
MSYLKLQEEILEADLCTSCGLCVAVCPKGLISFTDESVPLPHLMLTTVYEIADACGSCTMCSDICPGYDTGALESDQRLFGRARSVEERWTGIYQETFQLTTKDEEVLERVAAGGAGTTLAIVALQEKLVDAMIVVGREEERPWIPQAYLTDSVEKVIECAQSSYCVTPNLQLLADAPYERIGIIGVPCQIQGIQKLLNNSDDLRFADMAKKIVFTMEVACASSTSRAGTEHLITNMLGVELKDVVKMRYREGKYPGQFMVETKDGIEHYLPFYKLVEEFKKFKTFRCLSCPDWWSGVADISISDGDPNIFDSSKNEVSPRPTSTVMVRTDFGKQLIELAREKEYVDLFDYEFVTNLGLERKRNRYRHYQTTGKKIPTPSGTDEQVEEILSDDEVIRRGVVVKS